LLLTDPPFSTNIDDISSFANDWLPKALKKVSTDGRGFICIGAYPKEIQAYLSVFAQQRRFILDSPLIWTYRNTLGRTPNRKYNLNYQMILHFYSEKSEDLDTSITNEMFSVQDINAPDGRQGDRFHKWQKPSKLASRLIRHSTKEGDYIIDLFCGSGTFLVEAGKLNRHSSGCDIDGKALKIAVERGCNELQ
jgi:DNA modification methylase